jgi:hypothetical protein
MGKALDTAEAEARRIADEWVAQGQHWAAIPGASLAMFQVDQQMIERMAEAFEVAKAPAGPFLSAYSLAWTRCSLDATFCFNAWMLPWVSPDIRADVLTRTTERYAEATLTTMRSRSPLS